MDLEIPETIEARLRQCKTLPSPPQLALQLIQLCQDRSSQISDLAGLIQKDPALSAKLLQVVNCPLYGVSRQITTISRAITLLGFDAVRTTAMSFALFKSVQRKHRGSFPHGDYWRRSLAAAVAAQEIAARMNVPIKEELFLAALLQDIGMLGLSQTLGDPYDRVVSATVEHDGLLSVETACLKTDHTRVGAWLIDHWGLPALFRETTLGSSPSGRD